MLAEVVPAAPLAPVFAISLFALCALLVLIGLTKGLQYSLVAFLRFIAHGVRATHIPGTGWLASHIEDGAHWLYHEIGQGVLVFEKAASWYFHNLTALARYIGHEIKSLAYDLLWLYHRIEKATIPYWVGRIERWVLHQILAFAKHPIRYLRHAVAEVEHYAAALKKALAYAEAAALHAASVAGHAIAHPFPLAQPWIGKRFGELARTDASLWRKIKALDRRFGLAAMIGLAALALAKLGLTWARCRKFRKIGPKVCGMDEGLLDSLLADLLIIAGTISLVEFARECQRFTPPVEDGLRFFLRELHGLEG